MKLLSYDEATGVLTWLERPLEMFKTEWAWKLWNHRYAGQEAGCVITRSGSATWEPGSIQLRIFGKLRQSHRVIWLMKTGEWPKGEIDHKDRNPLNNRWDNLRDVDHTRNMDNRDKSGVAGVKPWVKRNRSGWEKTYWVASTSISGKRNVSYHDTEDEAIEARKLMVEKRTKLYLGEAAKVEDRGEMTATA